MESTKSHSESRSRGWSSCTTEVVRDPEQVSDNECFSESDEAVVVGAEARPRCLIL